MMWRNCYDDSWQGLIHPEAFSHPAKFARGLIHHIYQHALDEGWIKAGDWVLDPFAGVALGGLDAMTHGLNWVGVELESRFVDLGQQNISYWTEYFKYLPYIGTARIIQGDSRQLVDVVGRADIVISSPPFCDCLHQTEGVMLAPHQRADHGRDENKASVNARSYGRTPGNLANMKEGNIDLVVGSPPYAEGIGHKSGKNASEEHKTRLEMQRKYTESMESEGNLNALPEGRFDAVVSSPPYEASNTKYEIQNDKKRLASKGKNRMGFGLMRSTYSFVSGYGMSEGQLGAEFGDTFWAAARDIVQGCHDLLRPGGHAIFVTKSYVKNKRRVDFPGRWQALCESVGFKLVCEHRAMLVKKHGTQITIDGEEDLTTERKSFFRRLAEQKGSPRIDWEMVQCFVK